ncbi:hypothetical protein SAY87_028402 [Trapa incisa]|uniref:DUF7804 domain-containing protein n=2 Tax=Trapa TaxID=22665 RepID=A0AAN7M322_TRANT|nr:hypothetical protein SAY87_028402 [Trapa incisa]KAK4801598.1 hypothetical protein SAY86_022085 [Trapa natans]
MALLGIRCGGGLSSCSFRRYVGVFNAQMEPFSLVISNHSRPLAGIEGISISSTSTRSHQKFRSLEIGTEVMEDRKGVSGAVPDRRLDEWMNASLRHVVKSLREAPLFVQVYERNQGRDRFINLKTETEVGADYWDVVRVKWEGGEMPEPEGLMFVEELFDDDKEKPEEARLDDTTGDGVDQMWGILVQSKGSGYSTAACYLLKTTRVSSGLGFCAVHCHLMKVRNFKEKAKTQLNKSWLVQRHEDEQ